MATSVASRVWILTRTAGITSSVCVNVRTIARVGISVVIRGGTSTDARSIRVVGLVGVGATAPGPFVVVYASGALCKKRKKRVS